jgi:uncharacterized protein (DUF1810 family)
VDDPYRLERFTAAQDSGGTYRRAVAELRAGRKVSHWMWFIFPQVQGLGRSAASREFAISSLDEAGTEGRSAEEIFGPVDAMKLRSSMTLFAAAAPDEPVFSEVLRKYFGGKPDEATLARL